MSMVLKTRALHKQGSFFFSWDICVIQCKCVSKVINSKGKKKRIIQLFVLILVLFSVVIFN
jgi:hypothetical protein